MDNSFLKQAASLFAEAAEVIDLSQRLEQKKELSEQERLKQELQQAQPVSPVLPTTDELSQMRDRKTQTELQQKSGVWMHRFSDVRKDEHGFYILKEDNPAGNRMVPGHLLADHAINQTPYWSVTEIVDNKIYLKPIGKNPFVSGVGAGGAKLTDFDVSVFTGENERKRLESIQKKLDDGTATIDNVTYLLDGTVATRMGPNGAEGGWYSSTDSTSNRGGRKGMTPEQIMMSDAQKLKDWGFTGVPGLALKGTLEVRDWDKWVDGNGESQTDYVPKNLDRYVDFHRKMTEKGIWNYDDDALQKLRNKYSVEAENKKWEEKISDFSNLSKEEFKEKHGYNFDSLQQIVEYGQRSVEKVKKLLENQQPYLSEGEDSSEESVLKNIFHKERRVAIRNTIQLINMAKEDESYIKYMHDLFKLGGTDWYANEKVINFLEQVQDIDGLKLAAENLKDQTNLRYAYTALIRLGESEYVISKVDGETPFEALSSVIYNYKEQMFKKDPTSSVLSESAHEYRLWLMNFVEENGIFEKIDEVSPEDHYAKHHAGELLQNMLSGFKYLPRDKLKPYDHFVKQIVSRLDR